MIKFVIGLAAVVTLIIVITLLAMRFLHPAHDEPGDSPRKNRRKSMPPIDEPRPSRRGRAGEQDRELDDDYGYPEDAEDLADAGDFGYALDAGDEPAWEYADDEPAFGRPAFGHPGPGHGSELDQPTSVLAAATGRSPGGRAPARPANDPPGLALERAPGRTATAVDELTPPPWPAIPAGRTGPGPRGASAGPRGPRGSSRGPGSGGPGYGRGSSGPGAPGSGLGPGGHGAGTPRGGLSGPQQRPAAARPAAGGRNSAPEAGGDWPGKDWDSMSDVDYWAELVADKPLATMAQPAGTAGPASTTGPASAAGPVSTAGPGGKQYRGPASGPDQYPAVPDDARGPAGLPGPGSGRPGSFPAASGEPATQALPVAAQADPPTDPLARAVGGRYPAPVPADDDPLTSPTFPGARPRSSRPSGPGRYDQPARRPSGPGRYDPPDGRPFRSRPLRPAGGPALRPGPLRPGS